MATENTSKRFVLTDDSLNCYGFWIDPKGVDLTQFKRNPIMLWMHARAFYGSTREVLPIGHWEDIQFKNGQITAVPVFDDDEFSQSIAAKVESGTLRMASVGITIVEQSSDPKYLKQGQTYSTVTKSKLREASIVDLGANDNALAMYDEHDMAINLAAADGAFPLCKITDSKQNTNMSYITKLLKLNDDASEADITETLQAGIAKLASLEQAEADRVKKLKEAQTAKAVELTDAAIRDGRIDDDADHSVRQAWLKNFDVDFSASEKALASISKPKSVKETLADQAAQPGGGDAWTKRLAEIEQKNGVKA
jgi:hypothetical protein